MTIEIHTLIGNCEWEVRELLLLQLKFVHIFYLECSKFVIVTMLNVSKCPLTVADIWRSIRIRNYRKTIVNSLIDKVAVHMWPKRTSQRVERRICVNQLTPQATYESTIHLY